MLVAIAAYRVGFTTRSAARYDAMEEEISRADRDRARVAVVALVVATAASRDGDGASLSSAAAETTRAIAAVARGGEDGAPSRA